MKDNQLCHYTNKDSLKAILTTRSLRLASLANMDDPTEVLNTDIENFGRYTYISSWSETDENIAMWSMYTNNNDGVMIKLNKNPFKTRVTSTLPVSYNGEQLKFYDNKVTLSDGRTFEFQNYRDSETVDRLKEYEAKYNLFAPDKRFPSLIPVTYTKNLDLLPIKTSPLIALNPSTNHLHDYSGLIKHKKWEFQNERRYSITILPIHIFDYTNYIGVGNEQALFDNLKTTKPEDYFDFPLSDQSINEMEVVTSSEMSPEDFEELKSFLQTISPSIKIEKSKLQWTRR
jgi:hypothetical protein